MKITILGGGSVRTPLFVRALIKVLGVIPVKELWIFDIDPARLEKIGLVIDSMVCMGGHNLKIVRTQNPQQAIQDSQFILSTIRVGGEEARVIDEKIPLDYRVLGQETTGPGGMAMALRTIPVMLDYARLIERYAPDAWLINFTNPVGIITQALKLYTMINVVGICDSPIELCRSVSKIMGIKAKDTVFQYIGINHLGWMTGLYGNNADMMSEFFTNIGLRKDTQAIFGFDSDFIVTLGAVPNEYLYYYYYNREAVENILTSKKTRGEQVLAMNHTLFDKLSDVGQSHEGIVENSYWSYMGERVSTYMETETAGEKIQAEMDTENVGYEGVALDIIKAIYCGHEKIMILNTINENTIGELSFDDVVEVPCRTNKDGIYPIRQPAAPLAVKGLLQQVKAYERYTIEAAIEGSKAKALKALIIHPLVPSSNVARKILDEYYDAHRRYLPQFERE